MVLFFRNLSIRHCLLVLLAALSLSACSCGPDSQVRLKKTVEPDESVMRSQIAKLAKELDRTYVDGWIVSRDPRIFKTPYLLAPASVKADFAVDYHAMLKNRGQDMLADWSSYVPYSKRAEFASSWWSDKKHDTKFSAQTEKVKVSWIHEALLDASELWWRSAEKLVGADEQSPATLAHDSEQDLVSRYAEKEGKDGSFATQFKTKSVK